MTDTRAIVHIGAGQGGELERYLSSSAESIVLVEPQPELAKRLRTRAVGTDGRVCVIEAAITGTRAVQGLQRFNLPEVSSLFEPTALGELYPGLRREGELDVATLTLVELLARVPMPAGRNGTLVIDAPGAESDILALFLNGADANPFNEIHVVSPEQARYSSGSNVEEVSRLLEKAGYDLETTDRSDPDLPCWRYRYNRLRADLQRLHGEKEDLHTRLEGMSARVADLEEAKDAVARELEEEKNTHQQARKDLEEHQQWLSEEKNAHQKVRKDLEEHKQWLSEEKNAHQKARGELEEHQQWLSEEKNAHQQARKDLEEHQQWLSNRKREVQELSRDLDATQTHISALKDSEAQLKAAKDAQSRQFQEKAKAMEELEGAAARELSAEKNAHQKARKDLEEHQQWLSEEKNAHKEVSKQLEEHQQWLSNRKREVQELSRNLDAAQTHITALKDSEAKLEAAGEAQKSQFNALEAKLDQLFNQQSQQLHEATNALGKHVTRSFGQQRRQLESARGLQGYFETGEVPLSFGDWAIGADLAERLVKTIEQNSFDLIIEFGSGTSTVLLAKAVANSAGMQRLTTGQNRLETTGDGTARTKEITSNHRDLPQRILSFEQDPSHRQETWFQLQQHRLEALVDLVHAPLVPTRHAPAGSGADAPLFHDCDLKLSQLAQLFQGRRARILVLVDGPHSPQGDPLARAPALGALLQYLSAHQLHIVLDDTQREGERQVEEAWANLCRQRGLPMQQSSWPTEKGAGYLIVNPD